MIKIKACCDTQSGDHSNHRLINENDRIRIALIGNPNVGKTLIFNYLTGSHQRVANFPGVTIAGKTGTVNINQNKYEITDLPGIYGFSSKKPDEKIAHDFLLSNHLDLIINVVDVSKLERNLFLTLQLLELQKNTLLVFNFIDKLDQSKIDIKGLEVKLGIPIITTSATQKIGLSEIKEKINFLVYHPISTRPYSLGKFDSTIENLIDEYPFSKKQLENSDVPLRWQMLSTIIMGHSIDRLTNCNSDDGSTPLIDKNLVVLNESKYDYEEFHLSLISNQYDAIQLIIENHVIQKKDENNNRKTWSDKIDKILLHEVYGFILFGIIMGLVFFFTFEISAPASDFLEYLATSASQFIWINVSNELLASFLADGIIGGVGFVLVFIPQIAFLFLFLSILEHSGYTVRVVFITDRFLHKLGISGKSIAPMLLGFGCNVPAIMATGSIADENERITMALVNPFLPCSARLPVFVIFASAIFGKYAGLAIAFMYFMGIFLAIGMMFLYRKTILKGEASELLLEMPDLALPPISLVASQVYLQVRKFIENAATWMAFGLLVMWFLSITGPSGYLGPETLNDSELMKSSWVFIIGDFIQPIFAAFDWDARLVTALIFGFIAKEIVVGSLGLIYGIEGDLVALEGVLATQLSVVSALAYMLFVLAYIPCIGTYFALRKEVGKKWANFSIINGLIVAWLLAFMTILIGGFIDGLI